MAKILVVDDDESLRESLIDILQEAGFETLEADGGRSAQEQIDDSIDLVITDIIMPEIDGVQLIEHLVTQHKDIKLIAMSGGGRLCSDIYLKVPLIMGVSEVINKPFSEDEILDLIDKVLTPKADVTK